MKRLHILTIAIVAGFLGGCGGVTNGNSFTPTQTNGGTLPTSKVQLAVGTAILPDGTTGLNVVTTFRQSNGLSAALVNTPSITGPPGFLVPSSTLSPNGSGGSGSDAGTNSITAAPQSFQPQTLNDTFGRVGGDFASGLENFNNDTNGNGAFYPGNPSGGTSPAWSMPFYSSTSFVYLIGPPAVPFFNDGTYPANFAGYMTGFTAFEVKPIAGLYQIAEVVPTTGSSFTFSASAALTSVSSPLPALPTPTFVSDGKGGGTATVVVPSNGRIVETLIYVAEKHGSNPVLFYTSAPISGTGSLHFKLADNLGPCTVFVSGCQTSHPGPSINSGDAYLVFAASFDYRQFEAEPPGNRQQLPTIKGSSGQADVSMSPALSATY